LEDVGGRCVARKPVLVHRRHGEPCLGQVRR
jgi:hypothetical protein